PLGHPRRRSTNAQGARPDSDLRALAGRDYRRRPRHPPPRRPRGSRHARLRPRRRRCRHDRSARDGARRLKGATPGLPRGRVSIVGAGPGDPELITVRGLDRVRTAAVLVYDRLVDPQLVAAAPPFAERIFAGKSAGFAELDQRAIEALLIDRARDDFHVVRLKGGDPFVFGRGGEEVAALVTAGIPVEVVPGVTSAVGVPASAGIPVSHRRVSSSVTIVTGHEDPQKDHSAVDWDWLAASRGTI